MQNGDMRKESGRWIGVWLALTPLGVLAQQNGFVYIQSENRLPFRASWDAANYHSDSSGYLLIPQLPAGTQQIRVLANRESVELVFNIYMEHAPKGFTLRQKADNSWTLFDMVNYREIKGVVEQALANGRNAYISPLDPAPGSASAKTELREAEAEKKSAGESATAFQKPGSIRLLFQKASPDGIDEVYLIEQADKTDTIALFIPVLKGHIPPPSAGNREIPGQPIPRERLAELAMVPKH